ncbi:MotA/TolQ/ExbB proton channel family protein [bacterium]|nr:MotA/TolQ/ExbB proton channel family protein [bacterium]
MKVSMIFGIIILIAVCLYGMMSGTSLLLFINPPSLVIVVGILVGGILVPFGCSIPLNAMKKAHQKEGVVNPDELRQYLQFFDYASRLSIGAGIVGTLIGITQMLALINDPSMIGPSLAVALLTAFYGVLLSELVFRPLKHALMSKSA